MLLREIIIDGRQLERQRFLVFIGHCLERLFLVKTMIGVGRILAMYSQDKRLILA